MRNWIAGAIALIWICSLGFRTSFAQEEGTEARSPIEQARLAMRTGDYLKCIEIAEANSVRQVWNENWPLLLIEVYLTTGRYEDALYTLEHSFDRFGDNIRIRLLGLQVYRMNDQPAKGLEQLDIIDRLIQRTPWRYTTPAELIPLGEYFLLRGEDPKQVLKACFDQSIKISPKQPEAHVATARMALDKNDAKVASQSLAKALALDEESPEIHFLLAKAWASTDAERATAHLKRTLEINPRYIPAMIKVAEEKMNEESYDQAIEVLSEVEKVNPKLPLLWALRAAIAHLQGRYEEEGKFRTEGMEPWKLNPEVDYTIGKHLGMHYRFQESVTYQRRALAMDEAYLPAKTQLAQDLLRLGNDSDGWKMVEEVRGADPYDVTIFNLKQLQRELDKFSTLEAPGFVVRMEAKESRIYGAEVLALLTDARDTLTKKYDVKLEEPIFVEIFPRQRDFAIRTFGLPGGQGFLGVCFGRLITANSPAALSVNSNWKSVLWHEYCHVVTLQKTKNKMPRWLSEGISVYEERLQEATWGQSMDPTYRRMILGEDFFPISNLSSAFLKAKSPMHLQFAYYESSLAVEFFIEHYGMPAMLKLLDDLALGMPMNDALRRAPGTLEALDQEFEAFAKKRANAMGESTDWSIPSVDPRAGLDRAALEEWYESHPDAYVSVERGVKSAIEKKDWEAALERAEKLKGLWPEDHRESGVYGLLSLIYRGKEDRAGERENLVEVVTRSSDALESLLRLSELDREENKWEDVVRWHQGIVAIQPLRYDVQETLAKGAEQLEQWPVAEAAWKACLELDPLDIAWVHYRIAESLDRQGKSEESKEHLLFALEESPRFKDALRMLVRINEEGEKKEEKGDKEGENKAEGGDRDKDEEGEESKDE